MSTCNEDLSSSSDHSADCKRSIAHIVRRLIHEKLRAVEQEILAMVNVTVEIYKEEASCLRQDNYRLRRELEVLQPTGHSEEEQGEDDEEEESAEEPVQRTSLDQEDLRDPDHQTTNTRGPSLKRKRSRSPPGVCLLQDSPTSVLKKVDEPVCEEEEEAGGGELPEEEEQQTRHSEEEEGEDDDEEESAEEPVQRTSLDQEDLRDPDHQITNTRGPSLKRKGSRSPPGVCLLQDSPTSVLKKVDEPVCEEEEEAGGGELPEEEEQQTRHSEEEEGEDDDEEESAEEPVQRTSLDQEDLRDPDHQITNTRGPSLKRKGSRSPPGVCLLQDSPTSVLKKVDEPVCEEEEEAGGGELPEEEEQQTRHSEEEEGEDDDEEESAEEPVQRTSLDQEDLRDPDHQITNTRCPSVKKKCGTDSLNLRVCLLLDSQTTVLTIGVLKSPMHEIRCPRGLQEPDFLDLLRSTFPQLTRQFDVFTTDATRKLTPLKLKTLTPEAIQRSIKSTGKGRSALYIRVKQAKKSVTSTEELPPQRKDEDTNDTRVDENGPCARSHNSPVEKTESSQADRPSSNSRRPQQMEMDDDGKQCGISEADDFSALSSARYAAESDNGDADDEMEEDD